MDIKVYDNFPTNFSSAPAPDHTKSQNPAPESTHSFLSKSSFSKNSKSGSTSKCLTHPEEPLQFYCFNTTALLCGECLATGQYAGFEVMNIKRAAERVREKLKGLAESPATGNEDFYLIEKEMEGHEAQIEKTIGNYKREVKEKMDLLRSAIDAKEQEVLEKITKVHEGKLKAVRDVLGTLKGLKDGDGGQGSREYSVEGLSDLDVCQYYTTKAKDLNNDKNEEVSMKIEKTKRMVEVQQSHDQMCFSKFEEEFKRVHEHIRGFNVDVGTRNSPRFNKSEVENKLKGNNNNNSANFASKYSAYYIQEERKQRRKETEDGSRLKGQTPRQTSVQKNSFLDNSPNANNVDPSPRTPAKQGSPRLTFLSEKKEGLDNSQKSFSKHSSPMLNNYKEWFSQKIEANSGNNAGITPKGSAREETISINSFRSGMASNKALRDSFFLAKPSKPETNGKTMLETSIDQVSLCRTAPDFHGRDVLSASKLLGKNEGVGSFDFDNPFMSKKGQSQVEGLLASENRLKEKLKKLNSQIFKY